MSTIWLHLVDGELTMVVYVQKSLNVYCRSFFMLEVKYFQLLPRPGQLLQTNAARRFLLGFPQGGSSSNLNDLSSSRGTNLGTYRSKTSGRPAFQSSTFCGSTIWSHNQMVLAWCFLLYTRWRLAWGREDDYLKWLGIWCYFHILLYHFASFGTFWNHAKELSKLIHKVYHTQFSLITHNPPRVFSKNLPNQNQGSGSSLAEHRWRRCRVFSSIGAQAWMKISTVPKPPWNWVETTNLWGRFFSSSKIFYF